MCKIFLVFVIVVIVLIVVLFVLVCEGCGCDFYCGFYGCCLFNCGFVYVICGLMVWLVIGCNYFGCGYWDGYCYYYNCYCYYGGWCYCQDWLSVGLVVWEIMLLIFEIVLD